MQTGRDDSDIIILGGGLSGSLIAWRLRSQRPEVKVRIVERGETLGGNHTWSFHETDIPAEVKGWIAPLIRHRWSSQEVRFPAYRRPLRTGYCSVTSEALHEIISRDLPQGTVVQGEVATASGQSVQLKDGRRLEAGAVIDARGQRGFEHLVLGYQKFVGCVFRFTEPHGFSAPIIMDATVPQLDGYRFVYVLPFTEDTALIEDTYYADGSIIDTDDKTKLLFDYAKQHGLTVAETLRTESGVLPVALGGDIEAHLNQGTEGVAAVGLRAGLFHPLTGYSLPDAARVADMISESGDLSGAALASLTRNHAVDTWKSRGFYRMLSRFLFEAAEPQNRYLVMQRFYRLNVGLVERFYAGQSLWRDKLRVLSGKPPVNFMKAFSCINERQWTERMEADIAARSS